MLYLNIIKFIKNLFNKTIHNLIYVQIKQCINQYKNVWILSKLILNKTINKQNL